MNWLKYLLRPDVVGGPPYSPGAVPVDHLRGFFFGRMTLVPRLGGASGDASSEQRTARSRRRGREAEVGRLRRAVAICNVSLGESEGRSKETSGGKQ